MKLNEAKSLIARMTKRLNDLSHKRITNSVVEIAPGEDPLEYISEKPEEITKQMIALYEERKKLKDAFRRANIQQIKININEEEQETSIAELIDFVKDIRMEVYYFNTFSKKLPKMRLANAKQETIQVITFDKQTYELESKTLEDLAEQISNVIDHYDSIVDVEYTLPDNLL